MQRGNILIVDDSKNVLLALEMFLAPEFNLVTCLSNPNLILAELKKESYHLVLLDMNFRAGVNTGNEGLYWLGRIREELPDISVVPITAYGDVELAVKALKAGATDFVLKPWDNARLLATVISAVKLGISRGEIKGLRQKERELINSINSSEKKIIGSSPEIESVMRTVEKVAKTDTSILITGENGTGKELIAKRIHDLSDRREELMVTVDMGAVTETLFESELFGHVKGAFTDAREHRTGKFELASGGTLFLDEIANLPQGSQAKLLSALQNRQITRVGSNIPLQIDIRLISATNRDLTEMAGKGGFREDLLYRINTILIEVPPLRNRKTDIPLLAGYFLKKYSEKYQKNHLEISPKAMEKMMDYRWPGNIRELEHSIEKAVILSETEILRVTDLFHGYAEFEKQEVMPVKLEEMEKKMIIRAIVKNMGNIKAAASQLGITRQTLYNKMKKYNIE